MKFLLLLVRGVGIQIILQYFIKMSNTQLSFPHGGQYLNIKGIYMDKLGDFFPHQINQGSHNGSDIPAWEEKEIFAGVIQGNMNPFIDFMSVGYNLAGIILPVDLSESHHRKHAGFNDILQHISGSNTWKLIGVPHQDESCPGNNCF